MRRTKRSPFQETRNDRLRFFLVGAVASNSPSVAEVTAATNFLWKSAMKTVIEGNDEAAKALALAGAGVMVAMLMCLFPSRLLRDDVLTELF